MFNYLVIFLLLLIIIVLSYILYKINTNKTNKLLNKFNSRRQKIIDEYNEFESGIQKSKIDLEKELDQINTRLSQRQQDSSDMLLTLEKTMSQSIESYRKKELELAKTKIAETLQVVRQQKEEVLENYFAQKEQEKNALDSQLNTIKNEVDSWQKKREAINQDILRQRQLEEQQDFYRIVLSDDSIQDIEVLKQIRKNLHNQSNLDKMIYDNYIAKPVLEMTKRVLEGTAPSGIYKITRLKTGEVYIGKSTDIKARWQQHAKTAFNCGNIAHSILHTTIMKDGIQNFTFELVEKVPKDKLSEREKFWIDFYGSKKYGLNEKAGG